MQTATFRKWLAERGCRFDRHEHQDREHGHSVVTVHRHGRTSKLPLGGTRQSLDWETVQQICNDLGLDSSELPGPKGRV
jgi:hypothetical protein